MRLLPTITIFVLLQAGSLLHAQQTCSNMISDVTGYRSASPRNNPGLPSIPEPTDPTLVRFAGGDYISRVVGPGTDSEFNSDGTLKSWTDYVSKNIVSPTANISIVGSAYSIDWPPSGIYGTLYVNGYPEQDLFFQINNGISEPSCIQISTQHLHFARLSPPGTTPGPHNGLAGQNTFTFVLKVTTCEFFDTTPVDCGDDASDTTVEVQSLQFKALAPVVLVHGISDDYGDSFSGVWSQWPDLPFTVISFDSTEPLGSKVVRNSILSAAAQFGSQHVHLVAHSKGGLWSRAFLASKPNNFGVYSLTTICTPHHGSVAADIAVAKHQVGLFNPLVYDPAKILPIYTPYSDSMIELQVAESESRNRSCNIVSVI